MYADPASGLVRLLNLGIPEKTARAALEVKQGNVDEAAEYALSGKASKDEASHKVEYPRKRGWMAKYGAGAIARDHRDQPTPPQSPTPDFPSDGRMALTKSAPHPPSSYSGGNLSSKARSHSSSSLLTKDELDQQASQIILNALERSVSHQSAKPLPENQQNARSSGSFSKMSLSSMMGGLSALSLSRSSDGDRGRSKEKDKEKGKARASSLSTTQEEDGEGDATRRGRSQSPFRLRRMRIRDPSPAVEALSQSDVESDVEVSRIRPRNAFSLSAQSDDESADETEDEEESDEEEWNEGEQFDPITEQNTERNAQIPTDVVEPDTTDVPDPLGEGVNVVVPPEPYFPTTLNGSGPRNPRRRKTLRTHDPLPLDTSRPAFKRDRCTITLTHGDPHKVVEETGRRRKQYVLASDLSEESRYALEWGIGTVLRDGDEMLIVTVMENEAKVDPLIPNPTDRTTKLRCQQERQALAYILVRQATSLLQRTRLNVTIACQAWHAKNARHMLLDIVDYVEPTMLIVGSRGLGNLKGILLGSTSHYLVQKCSVPVMVARRRLKRPPKRSAHLATHRARVSLSQAGIDRVAPKVDQDVAVMRDQIERDDDRRQEGHVELGDDDDVDTEVEGERRTPPEGKDAASTSPAQDISSSV